MVRIREHLGSNEKVEYTCRPSRKAFLCEYLLFIFVMLLSFTSLYPLIIAQFKTIAIIEIIAKILFYLLFTLSIILLIKVEYKVWSILYIITNHRVLISKGIFTEKFTSVTYDKITDLSLEQTFWDKVLNIGKLNIDTAGGDTIEEVLDKISRPISVKKKIIDLQINNENISNAQKTNPTNYIRKKK